jgi:hypothetical protein
MSEYQSWLVSEFLPDGRRRLAVVGCQGPPAGLCSFLKTAGRKLRGRLNKARVCRGRAHDVMRATDRHNFRP